ncbi:MAG: hypothetical protein HQK49_18860 [Oligoflexia bacterium]|nr:hypothetical protein [Oligoflexia bacterium]
MRELNFKFNKIYFIVLTLLIMMMLILSSLPALCGLDFPITNPTNPTNPMNPTNPVVDPNAGLTKEMGALNANMANLNLNVGKSTEALIKTSEGLNNLGGSISTTGSGITTGLNNTTTVMKSSLEKFDEVNKNLKGLVGSFEKFDLLNNNLSSFNQTLPTITSNWSTSNDKITKLIDTINTTTKTATTISNQAFNKVDDVMKTANGAMDTANQIKDTWGKTNDIITTTLKYLTPVNIAATVFLVAASGTLGVGVMKGMLDVSRWVIGKMVEKINDIYKSDLEEQKKQQEFRNEILKAAEYYQKIFEGSNNIKNIIRALLDAKSMLNKSGISVDNLSMQIKEVLADNEGNILIMDSEKEEILHRVREEQKLQKISGKKISQENVDCVEDKGKKILANSGMLFKVSDELVLNLKKVILEISEIKDSNQNLSKVKNWIENNYSAAKNICINISELLTSLKTMEEFQNNYRNQVIQTRDLVINQRLKAAKVFIDRMKQVKKENMSCKIENAKLCRSFEEESKDVIREMIEEKIRACVKIASDGRNNGKEWKQMFHKFVTDRITYVGIGVGNNGKNGKKEKYDYISEIKKLKIMIRDEVLSKLNMKKDEKTKNEIEKIKRLLEDGYQEISNMPKLERILFDSQKGLLKKEDYKELSNQFNSFALVIKAYKNEEGDRFRNEYDDHYAEVKKYYKIAKGNENYNICRKLVLEEVYVINDDNGANKKYVSYNESLFDNDVIKKFNNQKLKNDSISEYMKHIESLILNTATPLDNPQMSLNSSKDFMMIHLNRLIKEKMVYDGEYNLKSQQSINLKQDEWKDMEDKVRGSRALEKKYFELCTSKK